MQHRADTRGRRLAFAVALLTYPAASIAQGPSVLDLQTAYHVMAHDASIAPGSGIVRTGVRQGTFTFFNNGTMTGTLSTWQVTPQGNTFTPNVPVTAEYFVTPTGFLELDFDPTPAVDLLRLRLDPGATTLHTARYEADPEAFGMVAIEKSTGQTLAALSGSYHVYGSSTLANTATGYDAAADWGIWTFDGLGSVSMASTLSVWSSGGLVFSMPFTATHAYSVASDGAVRIDGEPGAVSANGDLFCVAFTPGSQNEAGLYIGVRAGASYDLNDLAGLWGISSYAHVLSPSGPLNRAETGTVQMVATTPSAGSWSMVGQRTEATAQGSTLTPIARSGAVSMAANGVATMSGAGQLELAFSDTDRVAVGRAVQNHSSIYFALRTCPPCSGFGTGTPGTGGIEPGLGMRTFPTLGNGSWRFAIVDGRGGAAAGLAVGFGAAPAGIPIAGGLVWVDPALVVATPFLLLGGAAGLPRAGAIDVPLPIPASASFAGLTIHSQAFVLDPAAPGGVAMSRGFRVVFCD